MPRGRVVWQALQGLQPPILLLTDFGQCIMSMPRLVSSAFFFVPASGLHMQYVFSALQGEGLSFVGRRERLQWQVLSRRDADPTPIC